MHRHTWKPFPAVALAALLLCSFVAATPTSPPSSTASSDISTTSSSDNTTDTNFNCPEDCQCVLIHHTGKPFLHAKCRSLNGLKSETPLQATLPIHSIDLSFLSLSRLSHSLEKLRDLTSIDLSHNELHEIGHLGRRIKKLNLKHNHITSGKLRRMPHHVEVLNLQHNDITYLPLEFKRLMHLTTLELSLNQINCSCETLEVRNWLQERRVFMEHAVQCSYPSEVKGKPWLQVKQSDICEKEKSDSNLNEDENELMMADQPVEGLSDLEDDEELGKDFIPIQKKTTSNELNLNDVEGSGDLSERNMPLVVEPASSEPTIAQDTTVRPDDEVDGEEGSGSGGGMLPLLHFETGHIVTDDFEPDSNEPHDDDFDNKPLEQPSPEIFGTGMGIFGGQDNATVQTDKPVDEEKIVPIEHYSVGQDIVPSEDASTEAPEDDKSAEVMHAEVGKQDDSKATYFLLGVIVLIVVGLILFVGIKRCKQRSDAANDAENPRQTELLDMDKKNPGKPIQPNGTENAPLIGEKSKLDMAKPANGAGKKPYDASDVKDGTDQQKPLINGNGHGNAPAENDHIPKLNEPNNEQAPHAYYPITPRYPTPKSPRASKYAQQAQGEPNNNNTDDAYLASSLKAGRYSPVYSPETGRVKIKLTETPRPKTPMLVTRSKSNAGDIITTPVRAAHLDAPPTVHATSVGGPNGYIDH